MPASRSRLAARISLAERRTIVWMLERRLNTPPTSSVGRLFDAVAALAGIRDRVSYEGQPRRVGRVGRKAYAGGDLSFEITQAVARGERDAPLVIDTRP